MKRCWKYVLIVGAVVCFAFIFILVFFKSSQYSLWNSHPDGLREAKRWVYKKTEKRDLALYVFTPSADDDSIVYPAIVFFHGGYWKVGHPVEFASHCQHFRDRGFVAVTAEYRLIEMDGAKPIDAIQDAKAAISWIHSRAGKLRIDPNRIIAVGGSAGGHLAAWTGIELDDKHGHDGGIKSHKPDYLILISAALDTTVINTKEKLAVQKEEYSPLHQITEGMPPTLLIHGIEDDVTPFEGAKRFMVAMKKAGNDCKMVALNGVGHGFHVPMNKQTYTHTLRIIDQYLVSRGVIKEAD